MNMKTNALAWLGLASLLGAGCQTYSSKTKDVSQAWRQGNVPQAAAFFTVKAEKEKSGKDMVVWRLEQGQALRVSGQWKESNAAFDTAEEKINWHDERAKTSLSQEAGALLSNQANLPYEGRDYDKIMLNAYKALNYLHLAEFDKARVELFRAYQRQQDAVENNKRRIEQTEEAANKLKDSKEKGADKAKDMADKAKADPKFSDKLQSSYSHLDGLKAYADYVNPFVVFLDAVFFMANATGGSDVERSRKSFERVLAFEPTSKFAQQDLETVDKIVQGAAAPPTTYVIFETGCAPVRDQIRIDVPLFFIGRGNVPYVGAAIPTLKLQDGHLPALNVIAGGVTETTTLLASMDSVVAHSFKNELPTIITKTLLSTATKAAASYAINKAASDQDAIAGLFAKLITTAYQASVNIADTRTWTTLPKEIQYCRVPTPEDRKLELAGPGGQPRISLTLGESPLHLVYVKSMSATSPLHVSHIPLQPASAPRTTVPPTEPPPAPAGGDAPAPKTTETPAQ